PVGMLQIRDVDLVAQPLRARGEIAHAHLQGVERWNSGRRWARGHVENRLSNSRRLEMKWRRSVGGRPAGVFIASAVLSEVANLLEFPDASLEDVLVLVHAARPRSVRSIAAEHGHDVPARLRRCAISG